MAYNLLRWYHLMIISADYKGDFMSIIGRERECDVLAGCIESKRPEFLIVYGRRRIGKTFLIREFFNGRFSFYSTGIPDGKTRNQLKAFNESLMGYGDEVRTIPKDWFEAFRRLRKWSQAK